jgi:23S rRNA (cytosine1962-C5)-methyltransferase
VTDLDLSSHALAGARRNFALNETTPAIARCPHELVEAEAFEWLAASPRRRFDLVVLDPPSLARREAERLKAVRAYERLARLGIARLAPRGILVACSCSAHVTAEEFFGAVRAGATKSERRFAEARTTGHPPDHPFGFREAQYLKAIWLRFD